MGMKPSEIQAAIAAGGNSLSFEGSTSGEGTAYSPAFGPAQVIFVPIPAGTNKIYKLRVNRIVVQPGSDVLSMCEVIVKRRNFGSFGLGVVASMGALTSFSFDGDSVGIEVLASGADNEQFGAYRWVLSPVFSVPFALLSDN